MNRSSWSKLKSVTVFLRIMWIPHFMCPLFLPLSLYRIMLWPWRITDVKGLRGNWSRADAPLPRSEPPSTWAQVKKNSILSQKINNLIFYQCVRKFTPTCRNNTIIPRLNSLTIWPKDRLENTLFIGKSLCLLGLKEAMSLSRGSCLCFWHVGCKSSILS